MILLVVGCDFRTAPIAIRERLAFDGPKLPAALNELSVRYDCEAVILSTCNRVELYIARPDVSHGPDVELLTEFLSEFHGLGTETIRPRLFKYHAEEAVRHLFRVVASLESMIVGEAQIAGQAKRAYELAQQHGAVGPLLNALFQQARQVARRVRTETDIAKGHVSVSSAAVEYVRQVFSHFDDKTILVIGAGKMGELTLRHLRDLKPKRILVSNRSPEKAEAVARGCGGNPIPWDRLDDALARADIILSTTGAPEPIVSLDRWRKVLAQRTANRLVILDIAVPRDFDPAIHDGDLTCLFNIDDLKRIRERTLQDRLKHVAPAESIVEQEQRRFLKNWARRRHGPIIARLTQDFEAKRLTIVRQLMDRLNGKLSEDDRAYVEGAFRLLQNQFLHGPISALTEEAHAGGSPTLLEALRKLFRLHD